LFHLIEKVHGNSTFKNLKEQPSDEDIPFEDSQEVLEMEQVEFSERTEEIMPNSVLIKPTPIMKPVVIINQKGENVNEEKKNSLIISPLHKVQDDHQDIVQFLSRLKVNVMQTKSLTRPPYEDFEDMYVEGKYNNDNYLKNLVNTHFNEKNGSIKISFLVGKYLYLRKEGFRKLNGGLNGWRSFLSNIGIVQYDKVNEVVNLYQYLGNYKKFHFVSDSIWKVQRLAQKISQYLKSNESQSKFWTEW
jgi:hypothetical protein